MKLTDAGEINRVLYPSLNPVDYVDDWRAIGEAEASFYKEKGYVAVRSGYSNGLVEAAKDALMEMMRHRHERTREEFDAFMRGRRVQAAADSDVATDADADGTRKVKLPFIQVVKSEEHTRTFDDFELSVRKIGDFVYYDERLYAIAHHPELLRIVELLLGDKPKLVQDMALLKPPQGGGEKPWHQDMAYRGLNYDRSIVGVWIALDEASVDNGCMHIIPRSHMQGGVPHYAERDWQLCDETVEAARSLVAPLQPGGFLLFHGMLHHGTPSNFSAKRRRALQFHYAAESSEMVSPKEYKRMFTNEMSGAQC